MSKNTQPAPARRREKPLVVGETVLRRGMAVMFPEAASGMRRAWPSAFGNYTLVNSALFASKYL